MRWFLSYEFVDRFAAGVLAEVIPSLPAPVASGAKVKKVAKSQQQRDYGLKLLSQRAVEFGRREKLNFFQKARLSKQLQDGLIRSGQSAGFAKDFAVKVIADLK